ncbi:paired domain-containing protein [Trichonephila clavipes]|nr:paired domain-containing protein [Trichonephila clavipes]
MQSAVSKGLTVMADVQEVGENATAHNSQNDRIWSVDATSPSSVVEHRQYKKSVMVWGEICASSITPLVFVEEGVKISQKVYRRGIIEDIVHPQRSLSMSEKSRLPHSLRWRVVGWREMGLSQADAAIRLNVSRGVVYRLWNQYQIKASASRRHVPRRPRATTPADRFIALSARRRRRISICRQGDQLSVYPSAGDREGSAYLGQENTFPGPNSDGLLYSLQTSPDSHWRAIQEVCSSGGNEELDIINPTLLKDTVAKVVE